MSNALVHDKTLHPPLHQGLHFLSFGGLGFGEPTIIPLKNGFQPLPHKVGSESDRVHRFRHKMQTPTFVNVKIIENLRLCYKGDIFLWLCAFAIIFFSKRKKKKKKRHLKTSFSMV